MAHWTEKTWMIGPIGQKAMALLASYKQFPNRSLQSLTLGAPEFYADDAAVQAQLQKESCTPWSGTSRTRGRSPVGGLPGDRGARQRRFA